MTMAEPPGKRDRDTGVVPVIALVMVTVLALLLAAGVYVWLDGFSEEDNSSEQAAALGEGADWDEDGDVEWIRLTLTHGPNAPYDGDEVVLSATDDTGLEIEEICKRPHAEAGTDCNSDPDTGTPDEAFAFDDDRQDAWDVGEALWVPCQGEGSHPVTVAVEGTVVLEGVFSCDASAS